MDTLKQPFSEPPFEAAPSYLQILARYQDVDPAQVRLSIDETAVVTDHAIKTLEAMRAQGRGPAFMKLGRKIYYRLSDIQDYMESRVFQSTREAKTAAKQGALQ